MATSSPSCPFTELLPAEIRLHIYEDALTFDNPLREQDDGVHTKPPANTALLFVNKQIYSEALPVFLQKNKFSLLHKHVCAKRICALSHACECGHNEWVPTSLGYPRLKRVEHLEIRFSYASRGENDWITCSKCQNPGTCYHGLSELLPDIVQLPKLRTFTIICNNLQDFILAQNGLKHFTCKTFGIGSDKIIGTQIGRNEVTVSSKRIVLQCPRFTLGWKNSKLDSENTNLQTLSFRRVETCHRIESILIPIRNQANHGRETAASLAKYFKIDEEDGINKLQLKGRPDAAVTLANFNMALAVVIRRFQQGQYEYLEFFELDELMTQPPGERWDFDEGIQQEDEWEMDRKLFVKYPDSDVDESDGDGDEDGQGVEDNGRFDSSSSEEDSDDAEEAEDETTEAKTGESG